MSNFAIKRLLLICFIGVSALFLLSNRFPNSDFVSKSVLDKVDCDSLFKHDETEIAKWAKYHEPVQDPEINFECSQFSSKMKVFPENYNENFPIAYSVLAHKDVSHVMNLIEMLWTPQNMFCIHVDKKSVGLQAKMQRFASCFKNVFVTNRTESVYWGGFPILHATLNCLEDLTHRNVTVAWKYFINLSAQDVPLLSNRQLVTVLRTWNGSSAMEIKKETNRDRFRYHYEVTQNRFGDAAGHRRTESLKQPPPHNLTIYKGNVAVVLSRAFTDWLLSSPYTTDVLDWLTDTDMPDEHFWSTMMANTHIHCDSSRFEVVKSYTPRYAVWNKRPRPNFFTKNLLKTQTPFSGSNCAGKFIRDVCVFGVGDLASLVQKSDRFLFVNKLYLGYQSAAYHCMKQRILNP